MTTVVTGALDLTFRIRTSSDVLADAVADAVVHLRLPDAAESACHYGFDLEEAGDEVVIHASDRPDEPLTVPRGEAITWVLRHIQRRVFTCSSHVAVHAAGVVGEEGAIVLPASSESGKSTLAAGLLRAGYGYLSDELVGFAVPTGEVHGYPKPISLDPGSWDVLPDLEPVVDEAARDLHTTQWQVDPEHIRPGSVTRRSRLSRVIFPRYVAGATTEMRPMSRSAALERMIKATFGFVRHGRGGLDALVTALHDADCYEMTVGDLDAACSRIIEVAPPAVTTEPAT